MSFSKCIETVQLTVMVVFDSLEVIIGEKLRRTQCNDTGVSSMGIVEMDIGASWLRL
jgi:hypothetical protein